MERLEPENALNIANFTVDKCALQGLLQKHKEMGVICQNKQKANKQVFRGD